ncbi:alpha/beta fold hydrolase [Methylobacterium nonmethylotrophicum]|uniref:Alpha/beta fold hydrolase n=1 Tax=Methylobacterium nonmethylotrophicum TaxID=1141884 RepID=A0A4Z0NTY8_9HYPH|nr:alpha/beta fold hydrolase [Methylobacterium nonmethylotrophicum]TGE00996.1 alpha/beta fold hydrolase [Methylobacterium nonmethylotrophicum]
MSVTDSDPLLFLPGLLNDAVLWRAPIDALADRAAAAVADLTLDDSIAAMARRALTAAPPRFSLVALSMGGYVAFEILRQAPERVTRLALFDTGAGPESDARAADRRRGMDQLKVGRFAGVTTRLLPKLVHASHVHGPVGEAVKAMAERVGGAAFLRQQRAILDRADSRPLLAEIRVPTLVAVGEDDLLTPPALAREIHQGIAGSRLHVLAACGHLPPLERPEATSALLRDWLEG